MNIEDKVLEHFGYDVVLLSDAQKAIEEAEIRQKKRYRKEIKELRKELAKFKGGFKAYILPF